MTAPGPGAPWPVMPDKHLGWAIAALALFWPVGIPAIINSGRVEPAWWRGDVEAAHVASGKARRYGLIALGVHIVLWVVWVVTYIVLITTDVIRFS